jgi:hypothetical protein
MSNSCLVILTLNTLLSSTSLSVTASETSSPPELNLAEISTKGTMAQPFVPGEVLIKFRPSVSRERIDAILKENGTALMARIKGSGVHRVRIVGKDAVESVVKKLSALQEVEYAEPNFRFRTQ